MSEAYLDDALDGLVPAATVRADWADVLRRARRTRRRYAVAAAIAAALVIVPTAFAFGGRLADWFHGKPAPASIRQDFIRFNTDMQRMSAFMAKQHLAQRAPQAIASRAHGVLALRTADGPAYLWAAPRRGGGACWLVQLVAGKGSIWTSGCDEVSQPPRLLTFSTMGGAVYPSEEFVFGRALGGATSVVVDLSDGEKARLPVVEGLFMGAFPKHVHPVEVVSYNATGTRVVGFGTLAGGTTPLSPALRHAQSRVGARGTPFPLPVNAPVVRGLIARGYERTAVLLATRAGRNYFRLPRANGQPAYGTGRVGLPSGVGRVGGRGPRFPSAHFPSADDPVLDMSTIGRTADGPEHFLHVGGIAADGVARVVVKDREGRGLLWLPVRDNVYDSGAMPVPAGATQLDAQDAKGGTVALIPL